MAKHKGPNWYGLPPNVTVHIRQNPQGTWGTWRFLCPHCGKGYSGSRQDMIGVAETHGAICAPWEAEFHKPVSIQLSLFSGPGEVGVGDVEVKKEVAE